METREQAVETGDQLGRSEMLPALDLEVVVGIEHASSVLGPSLDAHPSLSDQLDRRHYGFGPGQEVSDRVLHGPRIAVRDEAPFIVGQATQGFEQRLVHLTTQPDPLPQGGRIDALQTDRGRRHLGSLYRPLVRGKFPPTIWSMRRALVVLIAVTVVIGPAVSVAGEPWRPGIERAIRYAEGRSGSISFAVIGPAGRMYGYRRAQPVPSASVIKVMFMTAYLRQPSVHDRALHDDDRSLLGPMIKRSDNEAATRIADLLGPGPINRLARVAGMREFRYTRPWGLSTVSARDQASFMFRLERYIPERHESYARYLLSHIARSQRWGLGRLNRPNWDLFFKGGWGTGTGAVCHQVAFLERGDKRIAVAIMILDSPDHAYATETSRALGDRLLDDLPES